MLVGSRPPPLAIISYRQVPPAETPDIRFELALHIALMPFVDLLQWDIRHPAHDTILFAIGPLPDLATPSSLKIVRLPSNSVPTG